MTSKGHQARRSRIDGYYLSESHEAFRQKVRVFAEEELAPHIVAMEATGEVQRDLAKQIARTGWLGLTIPRAYGGLGAGHVAKTISIEEISRVVAAMGATLQAFQLGIAKIQHYGSEEQKRQWLPRIASGEILPTIAVTEHESGGHVRGMETTAVRAGRHYILNGGKVYVGGSETGDLHGVVARTGTRGDGKPELTAFLIEKDAPGLRTSRPRTAMGLHGFSFDELTFDGCRVPARNRLGKEGEGLKIAYSSSVTYGRPNLTAVALGLHQAIHDETVAFCKARERYGKPLGDLDIIRARLGRIRSRLMTARTLAYQAAHMLDAGQPCDAELMNAKLVGAEGVMDSAREAMEIHGAAGLFTDRPIERYYRDAAHIYAPAGTGEVQLLRLGQQALGHDMGQWSALLADALTAT
jgi:acyl-CoA dehydrogenase